tara:strand:- start:101 stop:280 length:180 start_codon:yes stop_codon:yes gene_type:complete
MILIWLRRASARLLASRASSREVRPCIVAARFRFKAEKPLDTIFESFDSLRIVVDLVKH